MSELATEPNSNITSSLPLLARTRSGVEFAPNAASWVYRDAIENVHLNFSKLPLTPLLLTSAKCSLLWYAEHMSSAHLKNMFERLCHFAESVSSDQDGQLEEINGINLINYQAKLTEKTRWYLGSLSGFLKRWHSLGYPGVTADAIKLLKQIRKPGNKKGEAVLTHDPIQGPFTDIELQALQFALDQAYETEQFDKESYLLACLFMLFGQRSAQYAALKVRDVAVTRATDGTSIYTLSVPRAKQRNQLVRAEHKTRILIPQIGVLLLEHANEIQKEFRELLHDSFDAPLFPSRQKEIRQPDGFAYHRTAETLSDALEKPLKQLRVMSERTGQPLHINARRFRRTVATRAAIEGHSKLIIAELLDHTDTQSVGIYIEARPEIIKRIDRAMAMHLAPMAQAFAGVLIRDESEALRLGDPTSRVCDPRYDTSMKPLGNCGKHGFCGLFAPISCYTCVNFQP
ncbi:MAG: site-specific integrase, partial [Telluria sp.]